MPKSLDDLSDRPLPSRPALTEQAQETILLCEDLLDDARYQWAWGTISGIRESITLSGRASEGQRTALSNIRAGGDRERTQWDRVRWGRRYEGY